MPDQITQEWFQEWFSSPYWHILYKNRDRKEAQLFIDQLATHLNFLPEDRMLDLACGRGRHAVYLNQRGFDVTGIDISPENIAYARHFSNERLRFLVHDMRLPFQLPPFDYILNLFTSFGYFRTEEENFQTLRALSDVLKPGGRLIIDFMNTEKVIRELLPREVKIIDDVVFNLRKKVENGFIVKHIDFEVGGKSHYFQERVKVLRQADFMKYFENAGLRLIHLLGSYDLHAFDATHSDRMIFITQK